MVQLKQGLSVALSLAVLVSVAGCNDTTQFGETGSVSALLQGPGGSGTSSSSSSGSLTFGSSSSSSGGSGTVGAGNPGSPASYFNSSYFFFRDVSQLPPDPSSTRVINGLYANGGFGGATVNPTPPPPAGFSSVAQGGLQIDFSMQVNIASSSTPWVMFTQLSGFVLPDSDVITTYPLVPGGAIEGETNYSGCDANNNDCHLLTIDPVNRIDYEQWQAWPTANSVSGANLFAWNLDKVYPANLRGDQCTSADAAGFPIAPMVFTADEVASGVINHAIRFILPGPNAQGQGSRIAPGVYVNPATHGGVTTGTGTVVYGSNLRLRADYPISNLTPGAQVVARALQKYGMYLADGGNIALTAMNDSQSTAKWSGLLGSHDLSAIVATDFEVTQQGPQIPLTFNCVRNP